MRALVIVIACLVSSRAARAEDLVVPPSKRSKLIAAASIGAIHAAYATWSYFAWYRDHEAKQFSFANDRVFDPNGYAGGADKLGHMWSNYVLTRGTTAVLTAAGWKRLPSSLISAGLTELAFTLTEVQDGYVYAFEYSDMAANLSGAALAVLMDNVPALDRWFDFRVQYFPSRDYRAAFRRTGTVDIAQDYSGQSYILALHCGAIPGLRSQSWGYWSRYIDIAVGFEAKHYLPEPETRDTMPRQTLYFGLAFNMQGILSDLLPNPTGRRIANGAFEVYALPYTTLRFSESSRSATVWPPL